MRATQLLRAFDEAAYRRDHRALRDIDSQFNVFIGQEVFEARAELAQAQRGRGGYGRHDRREVLREQRTLDQLLNLQLQLGSLHGRNGRFGVEQKRALYEQAVFIAQRELRSDRRRY